MYSVSNRAIFVRSSSVPKYLIDYVPENVSVMPAIRREAHICKYLQCQSERTGATAVPVK